MSWAVAVALVGSLIGNIFLGISWFLERRRKRSVSSDLVSSADDLIDAKREAADEAIEQAKRRAASRMATAAEIAELEANRVDRSTGITGRRLP